MIRPRTTTLEEETDKEIMGPTSVRIPPKVKKDAEELVKEGYFGNLSRLIVTAVREKVEEYKRLDSSVRDSRKAKAQVWREYLDKAEGSPEKALKIMQREAQEEYESNPGFWRE